MERLKYHDGFFPPICFTCPARTYFDGEYFCDPKRLNDRSVVVNIARYRPERCPKKDISESSGEPPEIILRKMLRK